MLSQKNKRVAWAKDGQNRMDSWDKMSSGISIAENQVIKTESGQRGSTVDHDLDITLHSNCSRQLGCAIS